MIRRLTTNRPKPPGRNYRHHNGHAANSITNYWTMTPPSKPSLKTLLCILSMALILSYIGTEWSHDTHRRNFELEEEKQPQQKNLRLANKLQEQNKSRDTSSSSSSSSSSYTVVSTSSSASSSLGYEFHSDIDHFQRDDQSTTMTSSSSRCQFRTYNRMSSIEEETRQDTTTTTTTVLHQIKKICIDSSPWGINADDGSHPSILTLSSSSRFSPVTTKYLKNNDDDIIYLSLVTVNDAHRCGWVNNNNNNNNNVTKEEEQRPPPTATRTVIVILNRQRETLLVKELQIVNNSSRRLYDLRLMRRDDGDDDDIGISYRIFSNDGLLLSSRRMAELMVTTVDNGDFNFGITINDEGGGGDVMVPLGEMTTKERREGLGMRFIDSLRMSFLWDEIISSMTLSSEGGNDTIRGNNGTGGEKEEEEVLVIPLYDTGELLGVVRRHGDQQAFMFFTVSVVTKEEEMTTESDRLINDESLGVKTDHQRRQQQQQHRYRLRRLSSDFIIPLPNDNKVDTNTRGVDGNHPPHQPPLAVTVTGLTVVGDERNGTLLLSYGINDCEGASGLMDMAVLQEMLRDVRRRSDEQQQQQQQHQQHVTG